jgi:hypothetical protein
MKMMAVQRQTRQKKKTSKQTKKSWGVVQWLEHLPSKIEALSSKPQCKKKKKSKTD